ncbi:MAG: FecR domain-containing protein, partial [Pseudomonadota bacterium]
LEWRARLDDEEFSDLDRLAFQKWLKRDLKHEWAFDYADRFWDASDQLADTLSADQLEALNGPPGSRVTAYGRPMLWVSAAAAALIVCAVGVATIEQFTREAAPQMVLEFQTDRGAITTFDLEDGSAITLGAASGAEVSFTESERRVRLLHGDAFFDVMTDAARPFVVEANRLRVQVTGTAFDVRRSGAVTEVAVAQGQIAVTFDQQAASRSAGSADTRSTEVLGAGYRIEASDLRGLGVPTRTRPDRIGAWRNDRLVFEDAPISEIVADLNRYLEAPLAVSDAEVGAMTFSATVGTHDLERFVAALTEVFPIGIEQRADGSRVLLPRK